MSEANSEKNDSRDSETCAGVLPDAVNQAEPLKRCVRRAKGAKTRIVKGNLILGKDYVFDGNLVVKGGIFGKNGGTHNLFVNGNLTVSMDSDLGDVQVNGDFKGRDLNAWKIDIQGMTEADRITAKGEINLGDVLAIGIISVHNLRARKINAAYVMVDGDMEFHEAKIKGNISANNIKSWKIEARDVSVLFELLVLGKMDSSGMVSARDIRCYGDFSCQLVRAETFWQKEGCKFSAYPVIGKMMNRSGEAAQKIHA